jgi:phosphoglycolate phosphatase-like HAD superfamily hydrolase
VLFCALCVATAAQSAIDVLPSWNDTEPKKAIVTFVERVTTVGSPDFVPATERVATFDNDGTLWAEQPVYFELAFAIDQVKALAPRHPEWKAKEPFASLLAGDMKRALASGPKGAVEIMAATHAGMTTDEFAVTVEQWSRTARHPRFNRLYVQCVYRPMLELLKYLQQSGFKTYIVSGGGIEFMRAFAGRVYGIPPEQVIGSVGKQKFELRDGKPVLVKLPSVDLVDDHDGKPVAIQRFIGRRPIAAFGNSDGDQQMLEWTAAGDGPRLALLVHHTDASREWKYDRDSSIGTLNSALDEAAEKGWTVVSMKDDWRVVFNE